MTGKLSAPDLKASVLDVIRRRRKEVVLAAGIGEDCAVIDAGDILLVTTDPITGAAENAGSLAMIVSSNDIAASGGEPFAAFFTVIAPEGTPASEIARVMRDAESTAEKLNIEIAGGHTEESDAVNRMIISCTMLGKPMSAGSVFTSTAIRAGDEILLTGSLAQEYTSIAAYDRQAECRSFLSDKELEEAKAMKNCLSVLEHARILVRSGLVSAMHDVTEGGILGALGELLEETGLGAELQNEKLCVKSVTQKICAAFSVNPSEVLSSGNLLAVGRNLQPAAEALRTAGICAVVIGKVTDRAGMTWSKA